MIGTPEFPARRINSEDHDGVAVLIFRQKELPVGTDSKVPRCFSTGGCIVDPRQILIEASDTVVAAIRNVNKFAVGVH